MSSPFIGGASTQPNLSGYPLSMIERIEILPTTGSGLYGGGATVGVVNFVLRHDCIREITAAYGNSFASDSEGRQLYLSNCFTSSDLLTQMRFTGGFSRESNLPAGQRDFIPRGRGEILDNNASFFVNGSVPPLGAQTNLRFRGPSAPGFSTVGLGLGGAAGAGSIEQNQGHYNLDAPNTAQIDGGGLYVLRNGPATYHVNVALDHRFLDRFNGYVDATRTQSTVRRWESVGDYLRLDGLVLPKGVPGNPVDEDVEVTVPAVGADFMLENQLLSDSYAAGLVVSMSGGAKLWFEYYHSDWRLSRTQPIGVPADSDVAAGVLDVFRDLTLQPFDFTPYFRRRTIPKLTSRSDSVAARLICSRFNMWAGAATVRAALEFHNERFEGGTLFMGGAGGAFQPFAQYLRQGRQITSGYVETRVPLWGGERGVAAGRAVGSEGPEVPDGADASGAARELSSSGTPSPECEDPRGGSSGDGDSKADAAQASLSRADGVPFSRAAPKLEMQVAWRFDTYDTKSTVPVDLFPLTDLMEPVRSSFSSRNPTIGLKFSPWSWATFRGSFATGFLPPSGEQLAPAAPMLYAAGEFHDGRRGNEPTKELLFKGGGSRDLRPEHSRSWSAGVVLMPTGVESLEGLRASVDCTKISKFDNFVSPADLFLQDPAEAERLYGGVVRAAPEENDPFPVGPIVSADGTYRNISQTTIFACDLAGEYEVRVDGIGDVSVWARATWQPTLKMRATPSSENVHSEGVSGYALRSSAVAGVTVSHGSMEFGWTAQHYKHYAAGVSAVTIANQGGHDVDGQTFHDAFVSYRFSEPVGPAEAITVLLNAQNVFRKRPAFDAGAPGFVSGYGDPRVGVYGVFVTAEF
ncbi:MAG: TonB-dependent receptor [Gammaproteobacteria bacterium]